MYQFRDTIPSVFRKLLLIISHSDSHNHKNSVYVAIQKLPGPLYGSNGDWIKVSMRRRKLGRNVGLAGVRSTLLPGGTSHLMNIF